MLVLKTTIEIVPCVFDAGTSNKDVHAGIFSAAETGREPQSSPAQQNPLSFGQCPAVGGLIRWPLAATGGCHR